MRFTMRIKAPAGRGREAYAIHKARRMASRWQWHFASKPALREAWRTYIRTFELAIIRALEP